MAKKEQKPKRNITNRQVSQQQRQKKIQLLVIAVSLVVVIAVLSVIGTGYYLNQYRPAHEVIVSVNETQFTMSYLLSLLKYYAQDQSIFAVYQMVDELAAVIQQNELIRQAAAKLGISVDNATIDTQLETMGLPINDAFRDFMRRDLTLQKVQAEYYKPTVVTSAPQRHLTAMFLESEDQADSIRVKLEAGELFEQQATDNTMDTYTKDNKGDAGWHPRDVLAELLTSTVPGDWAFNASVGELSQPLQDSAKTKEVGYWIIKVIEKKTDPEQVHLQVILLGSEKEANDIRERLVTGDDFATLAKEFSQNAASKEDGGVFEWLTTETLTTDTTFAAWTDAATMEIGQLSLPLRDFSETTTGGYWLVRVLEKEDNRELTDDDRTLLAGRATFDWITAVTNDTENNKIENFLTDELRQWVVEQATGGEINLGATGS